MVCHTRPVAYFTLGEMALCLANHLNDLFSVNDQDFLPPPEVDLERGKAEGSQNDYIIKGRGHRKVNVRRD